MAKQNKTIFWILGIVILVALILNFQAPKETEMVGLSVHYYKDGVEVFPQKGLFGLFSIVTPPGEAFDQISLDISGTAIGVPFSNIRITDASPTAFKNTLPSTTQSLLIGQSKKLWTSDPPMNTEQFESMAQPVRFRVDVSAVNDYTKETVSRWGYIDLWIEEECIPHDSYSCYNNDVYWYDSCGVREEKKEECGILGCSGGVCCTSHASYSCYSNDVYWYSSCGTREDKKEECGTSGYTGVNYCYDNDVYRDYVTRGCSGSSCTSSTEPLKQEECGTAGCSGGVCNQPEGTYTGIHWDTAGSGAVRPRGITTDGNYIWIVSKYSYSSSDQAVYKYTMDGTYTGEHWGGYPDPLLNQPAGIATDGNYIWVTDIFGYYGVSNYYMDGSFHRDIHPGLIQIPYNLDIYGDYIWIIDTYDFEVHKYLILGDAYNLDYPSEHWYLTSENTDPQGITTDGNYIWIVDQYDAEVYKYNLDGTYTGEHWDTAGSGNTKPRGITDYGNYFWIGNGDDAEIYKYYK